MSKYKLTTLSPVHIGSGEEFELNYNLLFDADYVYTYDEFKIANFLIEKGEEISGDFFEFKKLVKKYTQDIIATNMHIRKIENTFESIDKPLLENVSSQNSVIVAGSSIKGSIRTAIVNSFLDDKKQWGKIIGRFEKKDMDRYKFEKKINQGFPKLFRCIKVSDSHSPLKTKVYKTINIKKDKLHQQSRGEKVIDIANFVEAIMPNQTLTIEIKDESKEEYGFDVFSTLPDVCNTFYDKYLQKDLDKYFTKAIVPKPPNAHFILNVGRFGGAEKKSIEKERKIFRSKSKDKSQTSALTFALEESVDAKEVFYENKLLPFGWVALEKIE